LIRVLTAPRKIWVFQENLMSKALIAVLVVIAIILLLVLFTFGQYVSVKNTLVSKNEAVKAAWSQVDIVLQRRADLIPNLVETVKATGADGLRRYRESTLCAAVRRLAATEDRSQWPARRGARTPAAGCGELSAVEIQRKFSSLAG
jgi:LemA family